MATEEPHITEYKLPCPVCPSSDAFHRWSDGHGYCFSCTHYEPPERSKDFLDTSETFEYVPHRGISKKAFEFYDCLTAIDPEGKPLRVGFKYPNGAYKIRPFEEKDFWTKGEIGKGGLYGRDKFSEGAHKYVTIVEGEYDALALYDVIGGPVVSVQSAATAVRDCTLDRSFLNSYERIYLAFDGDAPGRAAADAVAQLFDYNKLYQVKFTKHKDANDYVKAGEQEELRKIWWNSKPYLPETLVSSFEDIEKLLEEDTSPSIPLPFKGLEKMTYGFRLGEAVLFIAQEKVGKTEILHELEYHFLQTTDWTIGAIYLEETPKRHAQAIAGRHLHKRVHLPDSGVAPVDVARAYRDAVKEDGRLIVNSRFGSDDPDKFLDLVRFLVTARNCKCILFDHLTMVVSGHQGDDERKTLDYLSTKLEMMVKELGFLLIIVSHVNDNFQTRGSRNLTKVFDLTVAITRDLQHEDPVERRTMSLRVLYNRFNGESGPAGRLLFDPETGLLKELDDEQLLYPPDQKGNAPPEVKRKRAKDASKSSAALVLGGSPPSGAEVYVETTTLVGPEPEEIDNAARTGDNSGADGLGVQREPEREAA